MKIEIDKEDFVKLAVYASCPLSGLIVYRK